MINLKRLLSFKSKGRISETDPRCEKCVRLAIAGGIIIGCTRGLNEEECQHLPRQTCAPESLHPPEYLNSEIVVATTAAPILRETALYSLPDPEREGNTIHLFDASPYEGAMS